MRNVVFGEAGAKNFCPYTEAITIDLSQEGITQISGPNGSGKTTIFDIIPYALYGITTKGLRGEDVINDKIGKNCHVWLDWTIDDDSFRVDRYLKYTKKGTSITLSKNGEKPYKNGANEVKAEIERLLVPQKLFLNTLLFGQKVKSFFTDLNDSEQKEIFRNIINLGKYVIYGKKATEKIGVLAKQITTLENEVSVNLKLITDTQNEIEHLEGAEKSFYIKKNDELDILKKDLGELQKSLDTLTDDKVEYDELKIDEKINDNHDRIQQLASDINIKERDRSTILVDINSRVTSKRSELERQSTDKKSEIFNKCGSQIENFNSMITEVSGKRQKIFNETNTDKGDIQNHINKVSMNRSHIQSEMTKIHDGVLCKEDAECPECKQKLIDEKSKDEFKRKYDNLSTEFAKLEEEFGRLNQTSKEIQDDYDTIDKEINDQLNNLNKELDEAKDIEGKQIADVEFRLGEALKKLNELAESESTERGEALKAEIEVMKSEVANLNTESLPLAIKKKELDELMGRINVIISDIKSKEEIIIYKSKDTFDASMLDKHKVKMKSLTTQIKENQDSMNNMKEDLSVYEFWKEAFSSSGIPSMLIDEAIPFMNKRVSYYLDKLSAGRFSVSFDTMKETKTGEFRDKISINVVDNHTHANSRQKLSGGQTRLVDIATILTLSDLQSYIQDISFNIMIFDEIFDSLDDENIKYVAGVLKGLVEEKSIFLISHRHIDVLEANNEINLWS